MLQSIRRSLKRNGQLAVIEYRKEDPTIPIASTHGMSVADLRTEIESEGFTFDHVVEELPRQHIVSFSAIQRYREVERTMSTVKWREAFKFLSGAAFAGSMVNFYLWATDVSVPFLGYTISPQLLGLRASVAFAAFIVFFYLGWLRGRAS